METLLYAAVLTSIMEEWQGINIVSKQINKVVIASKTDLAGLTLGPRRKPLYGLVTGKDCKAKECGLPSADSVIVLE